MNIQIFGTKKCNDTKKAERFFKGERGPGDLGFEPTGAERRRGIKYHVPLFGIDKKVPDPIKFMIECQFLLEVKAYFCQAPELYPDFDM